MYFEFRQVKNYAKSFSRGHWFFQGPGDEERSGKELSATHLKEKWDSIATADGWNDFKEIGHPVLKGISAVSRGILKRKEWEMTPYTSMRIHRYTELLFRTIH